MSDADLIWNDIGPAIEQDIFPIVRAFGGNGPTATLYRMVSGVLTDQGEIAVNVARGDPSRAQQSAAGTSVYAAEWVASTPIDTTLYQGDVLLFDSGRAYVLTGDLETDTGTGLAPCKRTEPPV